MGASRAPLGGKLAAATARSTDASTSAHKPPPPPQQQQQQQQQQKLSQSTPQWSAGVEAMVEIMMPNVARELPRFARSRHVSLSTARAHAAKATLRLQNQRRHASARCQ